MSIDKRMPPLLPEDVVELLKKADAAIEARTFVALSPYELRELVTVWLRVAARYELDGTTGESLIMASILFGAPPVPDTEPHNEKPDAPFACPCGMQFSGATICPRCGEYVQ